MADIGDTNPGFTKRRVQLSIDRVNLAVQDLNLKIQEFEIQRDEKVAEAAKLTEELTLYDK